MILAGTFVILAGKTFVILAGIHSVCSLFGSLKSASTIAPTSSSLRCLRGSAYLPVFLSTPAPRTLRSKRTAHGSRRQRHGEQTGPERRRGGAGAWHGADERKLRDALARQVEGPLPAR